MVKKKKIKILKEFVNRQFTEIKKDNDAGEDDDDGEDGEGSDNKVNGNETGNFENGAAERTAPVLNSGSGSQTLESVAATAPAPVPAVGENANQNFYTANYNAKYSNEVYARERIREGEVIRETGTSGRASMLGITDDMRRTQNAWGANQEQAGQGAWGAERERIMPGMLDERRYSPKDDHVKEQTKAIDRRRRMM